MQDLIDYNRVLQQRNSFLKSLTDRRLPDKHLLEVYDEQLSAPGIRIFERRRSFLQQLLPLAANFYTRIAGVEEPLTLTYDSALLDIPFRRLLRDNLEKDLYLQRTGGGIHRDDIVISFAGVPFKTMASQGQRKSLLFALQLAEYETLKEAKGFAPLLLLDDVFEKLDEQRMHNLLDKVCLQDDGQVFITDTHPERIRREMDKIGVVFELIELGPDPLPTLGMP